jgi:hypothetical protein
MKTTIKYSHGKGVGKNLASVTILAGARTNRELQQNIEKARSHQISSEQAHPNL